MTRKSHYSSPNMLNFFWKFFILKLCFCRIRVDIELCTSRSQSSGILPEAQGQKDSLYFRWQHEPKYKMLKSGYLYTSRSNIKSNYLKGSLYDPRIMENQIEIQYRHKNILCLEKLVLTDEVNNYRFDVLEDWSPKASKNHTWAAMTDRKVQFWSDSCANDNRLLARKKEFKQTCTSHIFIQWKPKADWSCFARRGQKRPMCGANAYCRETAGGGICECKAGFKKNKYKKCVDIDECEVAIDKCGYGSICLNTPGSYQCKCPVGMKGNYCHEDINECDNKQTCNGKHMTCMNTFGSYYCKCSKGYSYNENTEKCDDINECSTSSNSCWKGAICQNTIGSYSCACPSGFIGNGKSCEDEDECDTGTHDCHILSKCKNILGSYSCSCGPGTLGNGTYCEKLPVPVIQLAARGGPDRPGGSVDEGAKEGAVTQMTKNGVWCNLKEFYKPWQTKPNCPEPKCTAELNIINAWHTETPRLNKRAASLYGDSKEWWGFSGTITVPMEHVNDFAIILRFSEEVTRGNFETWNLNIKSFTLTDGGYDLLLLPKSDKASIRSGNLKYEKIKPNQFQIVAQRLKSPIFPSIFFWDTSEIDDSCFGSETDKNRKRIEETANEQIRIQSLDQIKKIVLRDDEIRRIRRL